MFILFLIIVALFCACFLIKLFEEFLAILSKKYLYIFLKALGSIMISFVCFYYFEIPLMMEAAFAEEIATDPVEKSEQTPDKREKKDSASFFSRLGYFLWDYK
jgi:hypothetical protein